jgi:perosamine synthetase
VYLQPYYANLGFDYGYCPNAEQYYRRTVSLPMFPTMADSDIDRVVSVLREIFS